MKIFLVPNKKHISLVIQLQLTIVSKTWKHFHKEQHTLAHARFRVVSVGITGLRFGLAWTTNILPCLRLNKAKNEASEKCLCPSWWTMHLQLWGGSSIGTSMEDPQHNHAGSARMFSCFLCPRLQGVVRSEQNWGSTVATFVIGSVKIRELFLQLFSDVMNKWGFGLKPA